MAHHFMNIHKTTVASTRGPIARVAPRELLDQLLRQLTRRGVDYADARHVQLAHESLVAEQGRIASVSLSDSSGIGIRVLHNGSWGFAATAHLTRASLLHAATEALEIAAACARLNRQPRPLAPVRPKTLTDRRCLMHFDRAVHPRRLVAGDAAVELEGATRGRLDRDEGR